MRYRELDSPKPPKMPPLLDMPYLMREFRTGRIDHRADLARINRALGGIPHTRVVLTWLAWLIGRPKSEFPGGPVWYQYTGSIPVRVNDASDEEGAPLGRRLVHPGDRLAVHSWTLDGRSDFTRIDAPEKKAPARVVEQDLSWDEVRSLKIADARKYLGSNARGWKALEKVYHGRR